MDYQTLLVEKKDHVTTLYLNRPAVLNAFSDEMRTDLIHFFKSTAEDPKTRVVVVTGKGRAFSAGADLNVFKKRFEEYRRQGQKDGTFRKVLPKAVLAFPKPVIAAINGPAVGVGATMPLSFDIRLASTQAKFMFPFPRLGVTPEYCSSYFLPRVVGFGKAAELIYTAKMIDAEEALNIGLVSHVLSPEELLPEAEKMAREIAAMPPYAIETAKRLLIAGYQSTPEQMIEYETIVLQQAMQTEEHYEAVCKMLEDMNKNKP